MPKKETKSNIQGFFQGGTKLNANSTMTKVEIESEISLARNQKRYAKIECVADEGDNFSQHMYFDFTIPTFLFYVITEELKLAIEAPKTVETKSGLVVPSSAILIK